MTHGGSMTSETPPIRPLYPHPELSLAERAAQFPCKDVTDRMVEITQPNDLTRIDVLDIYLEYGDV